MNISIYLGNNKGARVDATHPLTGNPGIGGTQYCMIMLADYLATHTDYSINVIANREYILNQRIQYVYIEEESSLFDLVAKCGSDFLLLNGIPKQLWNKVEEISFKIINWSHNYLYADTCDFLTKAPRVVCNVFVGKQQYDRYIDHDIISKSTYIYNMYHDNTSEVKRENDSKTVVYMGSIISGKGFAELCSIWPGIIKEVPTAKLLVLGSGQLYGDAKLGPLGVADARYEKQFAKYITDVNGNIIPSVKFLGIVGDGKTEIFRRASVGVVNPSARTETFCMGVVEMAEAKLPVVTLGKNGLLDTVVDKETGLLGNSLKAIQKNIIALLKNPDENERLGNNAKQRITKFEPEILGMRWVKLLENLYKEKNNQEYLFPSKPYNNNLKWVRVFLRFVRHSLNMTFVPSLVELETRIVKWKSQRG